MIQRGLAWILDILWHSFLPVITLSLTICVPQFLRLTRASVIKAAKSDFIKTAQTLGLSERKVYFKHALRNARRPVVSLLGLRLGLALSGAIMTEAVFSWPGMGSLLVDSIFHHDYPLRARFCKLDICGSGYISDGSSVRVSRSAYHIQVARWQS